MNIKNEHFEDYKVNFNVEDIMEFNLLLQKANEDIKQKEKTIQD